MSDELPEGWARATLGELIVGFESGRNLRARGSPATEDEYGVLKISAVTWGSFRPEENKALLPGDKPRSHERIREGDMLISRANTSNLVGAVVLVDREHSHLMLPDKILRLRIAGPDICRTFLVHALRTTQARDYLARNATGTSESMRNLSQPKIAQTPVLLAPLAEQRRIARTLDMVLAEVTRAKARLDRVAQILERFRQSVLAAACSGKLTEDFRRTSESAMRSGGLRPDRRAEDADLPDGWIPRRLQDVVVNHDGRRVPIRSDQRELRRGQYPYYGASGVIDSIDDFLFDGDYLLIAEDGANLLSRSTPIAFPASGKFWVNNHAHVVQPRESVQLGYLQIQLNALDLQHYVTGSAQPKLTQAALNTITIAVPPLAEQQLIVQRSTALFDMAARVERSLRAAAARAEKLPQTILAKAFSGELVPTEAELARAEGRTYESAEQLLRRIVAAKPLTPATPSPKSPRARARSKPRP